MRARASDRESPLHGEYSEVRSWFSSFALGSGDQAQVVRLVIQATSVATYNAVFSPFSREGNPDVKEHVFAQVSNHQRVPEVQTMSFSPPDFPLHHLTPSTYQTIARGSAVSGPRSKGLEWVNKVKQMLNWPAQ